jgi:hypothetical protein
MKAEAEAGFFPFFFTESSGGFTSNVSFDDSGTMTVTASSPAGNPVILGAVVSPAGSLVASE